MAVENTPKEAPCGFGAPLLKHCPSRRVGVVGVFVLVFGLVLLALAYEAVLPSMAGVVGASLLLLGGALALNLVKTTYMVCPEGVLYYKRRQWRGCPWPEVKAIWHSTTITMHLGTLDGDRDYSCEILCSDGTRLKLKHIRDEKFIQWVEQEVYGSLVPKVQAQWASGQPVWFGAVSLSSVGIHNGSEVLAWSDVHSAQPERNDNVVVIRKRGGRSVWMRLAELEIPNLALFFQFVRENVRVQNE
jgi:hypothetical protein